MERLPAAVLILTSCMTFSAAAFVLHGDTNVFLNFVAAIVGVFGLYSWFTARSDSSAS